MPFIGFANTLERLLYAFFAYSITEHLSSHRHSIALAAAAILTIGAGFLKFRYLQSRYLPK